jgi:mannose-6-phosphate isomerase
LRVLYPLTFEPIYKERVWGGRGLEALGRRLPGGPDTLVGESWEVADVDATSPTEDGGGAARSVVANGPLAGRTLGDLVRERPGAVLGAASGAASDGFPLLVKYLDARENLSVQVHPSPDYAALHPEAHIKSEAWYVVRADEGASIRAGVRAGTTREAFAAAVRSGNVEELLLSVRARVGDCLYLPSGTCHALGAGILVAEVQTPSETTFRVFDWGRSGRELHLEAALECIDFGPLDARAWQPATASRDGAAVVRALVRAPAFTIDEWRAGVGVVQPVSTRGAEVWIVVGGAVELRARDGSFDPVEAASGRTVLLPAALSPCDVIVEREAVVLRVGLPTG